MNAADDPEDDNAFERLHALGYRLLVPVVPGTGIHPVADVYARRGKGPGLLGRYGEWYGMKDWQKHVASDEDLLSWHDMGAGTGIRTGAQSDGTWLAAIDADTLHPGHALTIMCRVVQTFGSLPRRIGNEPKALFPLRLSAPLPYMQLRFQDGTRNGGLVEVLGEAKHFVAAGIHPKTERPYGWPDALVPYADLPVFAPAEVEAFLSGLRDVLPEPEKLHKGAFETSRDQAALRGTPDLVERAVKAMPNRSADFPTRAAWLQVGYAIKAAVEDEAHAFDLFLNRSLRWTEGNNDPDDVESNWRRMLPPFRIGAGWIYDRADKLTGSTFRAEAHHEGVPEPEPDPEGAKADDGVLFGLRDGSNEPVISEDEAGIRFAEEYRGKLRYSKSHGKWFVWERGIWRQNETDLAFHYARVLARRMAENFPEKVRVPAGRAAFAGAVEKFARADPANAVAIDAWDRNPMQLGVPSGTVDIETGVLGPARPEDGISRSTAVAPADTAECPTWLRLLDETFSGDAPTIRFFQQYLGYTLTGDTREQCLVYAHGSGGNAKGLTINTFGRIMGDYCMTAATETFVAAFGTRHSTELAMLAGARMVKASEMEKGQVWAEKRVKEMTGDDEITARFMRQDNFTYLPTFKLIIMGNNIPDLNNVDDAMRRRFNLLPFLNKPAHVDPLLPRKLRAEWPGILRWAIDGCLDWQRNGLVRPDCVIAETRRYFDAQDTFGQWAAEHCTIDPIDQTLVAGTVSLFGSWSAFAKSAGTAAGTQKSFVEDLRSRFKVLYREKTPLPDGKRVRGFTGIALRAATFHEAA